MTAPIDKNGIIDFDVYRRNLLKIRQLAETGKLNAAYTVGRGGLYIALIKMAAGNKIGASVKVEGDILSPMFGSIVLEIPEGENAEHLLEGSRNFGQDDR